MAVEYLNKLQRTPSGRSDTATVRELSDEQTRAIIDAAAGLDMLKQTTGEGRKKAENKIWRDDEGRAEKRNLNQSHRKFMKDQSIHNRLE